MKRRLLTLCFSMLALGCVSGYAETNGGNGAAPAATQQVASQIRWYTNYSEAAALAQKENKPLVLFFTGSDWCGWCKKLHKEVFASPEFAKEVGNSFVFVELDFPMNQQLAPQEAQQNAALKQKYGVTGYPSVIVLSSNQDFIAETGYRPGGGKAYADYLKQLL